VPRPTLLVAEPEPEQALSVRKLVLETAKFNVITAHSTEEAIALFRLFPNVNAVVLVQSGKLDCKRIADWIKTVTDKMSIIGIRCDNVDYSVPSFDPQELLNILRELLGDPRELEL
jgi:DNA-binding response OmpR family regulator